MSASEVKQRMSSTEISDWQIIFEYEDEKAEKASAKK
jgi:hypothetical protein